MDTAAQTVTLADGSELEYDELIIATGLVPKTIPSFPDLEGIRVLRSLEESIALREHAGSAGMLSSSARASSVARWRRACAVWE